jgi:hypothetical protein
MCRKELTEPMAPVRDDDKLHVFGQSNDSLYRVASQNRQGGPASRSSDKDLRHLIAAAKINHG